MRKSKIFYRVANIETKQGLWYDSDGNFTGFIHKEFNFCRSSKLLMPFDENVIGWLSATKTLKELYNWFSIEDVHKLQKFGYFVTKYEAKDYWFYNNHWLIKKDTSIIKA